MTQSAVSGALNFRDTGGLAAGVALTRRGVLYRSGNLARIDDQGVADLHALGLRRIIDLRADDEVRYEPSRTESLDAVTQRVPLFLGSVASIFDNDISLDEMYRQLVHGSADGVVAAARGVVTDQPVLVHCTVGKDRTGVTVALILAAAGVDEEAIIADYARTEGLLPASRNAAVIAHLRARHPDARYIEDLATRSPAPVMAGLLRTVADTFGSAGDYLRAHGMGDDEISELRRVLID
ncbi:tyrosine-protein phosphatase [Microbacterium sp. C7(2022)]|uniref:tyrosine-protein phosphatase n=1 Tax=Microbacterium sp. C7(2022) TaxID=2992759 RepID=UPI00237C38CC|nr:tyrosine-protein phosphatase [Microbacterium sp. C7(2022)]MDE0547250.1 tyrosine-protein phosphatase [Microbacterium sp. C7(2022)]